MKNLNRSFCPAFFKKRAAGGINRYNRGLMIMDKSGAAIKTYQWHSQWPVLTKVKLPNGGERSIDSNGQLMEVINNDNSKTILTRNNRGEIIAVTDEENRTVTIDRDIMGNATEMIYPGCTRIKQDYDRLNRLTQFTNKRNQTIHYQYDTDSRLIKKTTPEGDLIFNYYDGNLIEEQEKASGQTQKSSNERLLKRICGQTTGFNASSEPPGNIFIHSSGTSWDESSKR